MRVATGLTLRSSRTQPARPGFLSLHSSFITPFSIRSQVGPLSFFVRALSMTFLTNQESKVQRASRWLGWALVLIHTLIAVSVASSFGKQGSEWWPVVFYAIDFPVSFPVILFFKHIHSFADWGTLAVFLVIGSAWHFYWPQFLVWGGRQLFIRLRPNEKLRSSP